MHSFSFTYIYCTSAPSTEDTQAQPCQLSENAKEKQKSSERFMVNKSCTSAAVSASNLTAKKIAYLDYIVKLKIRYLLLLACLDACIQ